MINVILRVENKVNTIKYLKKCSNCGSILTYQKEDLKSDFVDDVWGITCPICQKFIIKSIFDKKIEK